MKVSLIIPCYNEEQGIKKVLKSIPQGIHEIIVVDNNSTDKTSQFAREERAEVVFERRKGYGRALRTGFEKATGDIIVTLDGDTQYPAHMILVVVDHLMRNNLDFISCSRFPLQTRHSLTSLRILGNKLLTFLINFLFRLRLKDSQSGMWVFRKKILDHITFESEGWTFSEEIKIKAAKYSRFSFAEFPIPYYPRLGKSNLSLIKTGLADIWFLFILRVKMLTKV